jgi:membrane-associated phospholipid phosphatase
VPLVVFSLAGWLLVSAPASQTTTLSAPAISRPLRDLISAARVPGVSASEHQPRPDRLVYRPRVDLPVTIAATAAWLFAEVDKTQLAAVHCNWCDRAADGSDTLNGLDRWGRRAFRWQHSGRASALSNLTGVVLAPAAAYGLEWVVARHDGRRRDVPANSILITQAMAIAADVTEVMKLTIGRERPSVHGLASGAATPQSADDNTSFPSGHATFAFSLATSSWEIATLRGYRHAPWLLRAGLPIAALTAYLRVAADRHYLTDVLAGAGVGSAAGFGVPYLAHRSTTDRRVPVVHIVSTARGRLVAAQWIW